MLTLQHVTYAVGQGADRKTILEDINVDFDTSQCTVITGHNGSGKSTLIKLISGILQPTEGKILLDGEDITDMPIHLRARRGITTALQQPVRFKGLTVKNLIDAANKQNNKVGDVCEYLSKVGLCAKDYINRELDDTLSGGELKRIEIAMALAKGGSVYLFDEPEAGIDLWSFEELVYAFDSLSDKTRIIVSHQEKVMQIADRIIVLAHGRVHKFGLRDEILPTISTQSVCNKLGGKTI